MKKPRKGRRRPDTAADLPATRTLTGPRATASRTAALMLACKLRADLDDLFARLDALDASEAP